MIKISSHYPCYMNLCVMFTVTHGRPSYCCYIATGNIHLGLFFLYRTLMGQSRAWSSARHSIWRDNYQGQVITREDNGTGDPPHNRAELHTTEHCAAHNRASCRQNGGTWTRPFGTKTSVFRAFKCVTGAIIVKALFSVMVRHTLGKTYDCSEYSKVKNAICKHARLSKQIGPVVCKASSVVCRGVSWVHLCSVVCSVRDQLTGLSRR